MNWAIIAGPIIGAIIGYCTNYIAVKMLFRPLEPKYLFGRKLPFTPGIIPSSKDRIARAVGEAVGGSLLTQDALERNLLSPELKEKMQAKINDYVRRSSYDERNVRDVLSYYVDSEVMDTVIESAEAKVAEVLTIKILEMDMGELIANEVLAMIREKQETSFWAKLLTEDLIYSFVDPIGEKVNDMVAKRGPGIIEDKIHEEVENVQRKTVGDLFTSLINTGVDAGQLIYYVYETLIRKKLASLLESIDISKIVKDKMDSMDAREVEELTLKVAKKELNAIVNLGALIGFVLGLVNILFNL